jgi:alkaline phosphatase D
MKRILYIIVLIVLARSLFSQSLIKSGPMLGYAEMKEVLIWIQTTQSAKVKIQYWDVNNPAQKFFTQEITTDQSTAFTAKLVADQVKPNLSYEYVVFINGKAQSLPYPLQFKSLELWQWRRDAPDIKFALGSCSYINEPDLDRPGKPYGGDYTIFKSIYEQKPNFMLWLGDNIYLREADWNTRTGIFHRYTHSRAIPEIQPLLANTHHYAIWDDHDFGPNDSDRSFIHKDKTLEAFTLFWGNPTFGVNGLKGITTQFQWADADFFLLDNRYYKSPNGLKSSACTILGSEQKQWLIDALKFSKATFKFIAVGSQFINNAEGAKENFINCNKEREEILNALRTESITGVIFLTGDRHHSEISKLEREGTYPIYDFTISSLTSGSHTKAKEEKNTLRIPESLIMENNFATIELKGTKAERVLKITYFDVKGVEKYSYSIKAKELK